MFAEMYGGAVLGFLAVALAILLLNLAVRWHLADDISRARVQELAASSQYKLGVGLLLALLAYSNYVLFREVKLHGDAWLLIASAWSAASCVFAIGLICRAFLTRIAFDDEALQIQSPFHKARMTWTSLQRVEWNRYGWSFDLIGDGTTVSVSVFMVGIRTLLDQIERRASNVEMEKVRRTLEELAG